MKKKLSGIVVRWHRFFKIILALFATAGILSCIANFFLNGAFTMMIVAIVWLSLDFLTDLALYEWRIAQPPDLNFATEIAWVGAVWIGVQTTIYAISSFVMAGSFGDYRIFIAPAVGILALILMAIAQIWHHRVHDPQDRMAARWSRTTSYVQQFLMIFLWTYVWVRAAIPA